MLRYYSSGDKDSMFEYFMTQVPPNINVAAGQTQGAAAGYLQQIVDQHAHRGWEFYSVESFGILENQGCGCLGALLGMRPQLHTTYVVVFRRPKISAPPKPSVP